LQIWYDGADSTQFQPTNPASGDAITQWNDKSATAHNANPIAGAPTYKPIYTASIQNNKSSVWFDGVEDGLEVNLGTNLHSLTGSSFIWVGKTMNPTIDQQIFLSTLKTGGTHVSANGLQLAISGSSTYTVGYASGSAISDTLVDNGWHVHSLIFDGTQTGNANRLKYRIDGYERNLTFLTDVSGSTSDTINGALLGVDASTNKDFVGYMGEVLLYTRALSTTEITNIENYLFTKWGTSAILPSPSPTPSISVTPSISTTPSITPSTSGSGGIVTSGLVFNLASAPTSGTTWTDATGNGYNATLNGASSYTSSFSGGIQLANANYSETGYISVPYNVTSSAVTVEMVASFNPTSYWGTIWGNEVYNSDSGYFAYMDSATSINYGKSTSESSETVTASDAVRHWVFVINGTSHSLYLNGSQVGTTDTVSIQTLFASNNFYFGARHLNDGTGFTDVLNNSTEAFYPAFYQMRVYGRGLSSGEITQNFNAIKGTYGL
jgi:hypothetical protein